MLARQQKSAAFRSIERHNVQVVGEMNSSVLEVLTDQSIQFIAALQKEFGLERDRLLELRAERQRQFNEGALLDFPTDTQKIRKSSWTVAPAPKDLEDRRVEITGPVERKMMINALNSGAKVFMADFEDSLSPTWANVIQGQINLRDAVRRTLSFTSPEGKEYRLNEKPSTLVVRPRGWHLNEKHLLVDGAPVSASFFDFGLYFYHNAKALIENGSGPYFYLPKMESHKEAALWNSVFNFAQDVLGIPRGTIRATVLIETITAAFEMDEILYELKEHASGLNAGRWDYIFSIIKKFNRHPSFITPDRSQVTMTAPFMRAYAELLVKTCHMRGAHAIGGMAAFIPSRKDQEINATAIGKVQEDKVREANDGFDGTWVAHPDLVSIAIKPFDQVLRNRPHQKNKQSAEFNVRFSDLLNMQIPGGQVTEAGVRTNINVALQYLERWLDGVGAAAIHNLMEDAATAEISRAQLWQWLHHKVALADGRVFTSEFYKRLRQEELENIRKSSTSLKLEESAELLDQLVLKEEFTEFLTIQAYEKLQ